MNAVTVAMTVIVMYMTVHGHTNKAVFSWYSGHVNTECTCCCQNRAVHFHQTSDSLTVRTVLSTLSLCRPDQ